MDTLIKLIKIITGIVLAILGIEVLLKLLGALPTVFVFKWIYEVGDALKSPFAGILQSISLGSRFELDLSSLFAMFAYTLFAAVLIWLIKYTFKPEKKH